MSNTADDPGWVAACDAEAAVQRDLLRDIVGDPSRPFAFDPDWLSGEGLVPVRLARQMEDEGRYEDFLALAEALEQAGCRDRAVLDHCREPGAHVCGCWVVDALLGREATVRVGLMTQADWQAVDDPAPLFHFLHDKGSDRQRRLFAVACCRRIETFLTDERSRRAVEVAERLADGLVGEDELAAARHSAQRASDESSEQEYFAESAANFCMTPDYAGVYCRDMASFAALHALGPIVLQIDPSVSVDGMLPRYPGREASAVASVSVHIFAEREDPEVSDQRIRALQDAARMVEHLAQAGLLRDVFGAYLGPPGGIGRWLSWDLESTADTPLQQWSLLPRPRDFVVRPEWLTYEGGIVPKLAQAIYEEKAFERLPILADALLDAGCDDEGILNHLREPGPHVRGCWALDLILGRG